MTNNTRVVHCRKEPYDVLIDSRKKWGNPFIIGKHETREEVIAMYKKYILDNPGLLKLIPTEIKNKLLGCWCKPATCHGDVLAELADN